MSRGWMTIVGVCVSQCLHTIPIESDQSNVNQPCDLPSPPLPLRIHYHPLLASSIMLCTFSCLKIQPKWCHVLQVLHSLLKRSLGVILCQQVDLLVWLKSWVTQCLSIPGYSKMYKYAKTTLPWGIEVCLYLFLHMLQILNTVEEKLKS